MGWRSSERRTREVCLQVLYIMFNVDQREWKEDIFLIGASKSD